MTHIIYLGLIKYSDSDFSLDLMSCNKLTGSCSSPPGLLVAAEGRGRESFSRRHSEVFPETT